MSWKLYESKLYELKLYELELYESKLYEMLLSPENCLHNVGKSLGEGLAGAKIP